jgi:hypothetical protein
MTCYHLSNLPLPSPLVSHSVSKQACLLLFTRARITTLSSLAQLERHGLQKVEAKILDSASEVSGT